MLRNNYRSRNLIGHYPFWVISPKNSTSFTRPFLAGRHARAGHETKVVPGQLTCRTRPGRRCPNLSLQAGQKVSQLVTDRRSVPNFICYLVWHHPKLRTSSVHAPATSPNRLSSPSLPTLLMLESSLQSNFFFFYLLSACGA